MTHSAEKDAQRIEHERHIAECEARGECPFSGLTFARCQASICDCFREQYPDDPYGLHPEAFIVGTRVTPPDQCAHGEPEGECASCSACAACRGECGVCPYVLPPERTDP